MQSATPPPPSLDDLYAQAISLAERARTYFENEGVGDRNWLDEDKRVSFSLQRLRITTNLLAVFGLLAEARGPLRMVESTGEDMSADGRSEMSPFPPRYPSTVGLPAKVRELSEESEVVKRMTAARLGTPIGTVAELHRLIERALATE